jgi:hypothetical protein
MIYREDKDRVSRRGGRSIHKYATNLMERDYSFRPGPFRERHGDLCKVFVVSLSWRILTFYHEFGCQGMSSMEFSYQAHKKDPMREMRQESKSSNNSKRIGRMNGGKRIE